VATDSYGQRTVLKGSVELKGKKKKRHAAAANGRSVTVPLD
jgi:hypothetical protein